MKRTLLSIVVLAVALVASAQSSMLKKNTVDIAARHQAALNAPAKIDAAENQAWWGYVGADDDVYGLGVQSAETYDCAIFIPGNNAVAAGKDIKAVRFAMYSNHVSNVKVWVANSRPSKINASNTLEIVNVTDLQQGVNDVALANAHTIGSNGIYVGYTFTITSVTTQADAYPICYVDQRVPNSMWLRTSQSVTSWLDGSSDYGSIYLQVLLEGQFQENAASLSDMGEYILPLGGMTTATMNITNGGGNAINNIDYTISDGDAVSEPQHIDLATPINSFATGAAAITITADEAPGSRQKTVTITKVNGEDNTATVGTSASLTVSTISKLVERGVAVEEFTGTTCGWCPRGLVAMEKMRQKFGEKFIGIGIHRYTQNTSQDAMYISTYTQVSFSGAPSARLNRGDELDPYYGSANDMADDISAELAIPAKAGLTVSGEWNADSTKVTATAEIEAVADGNYAIEFVLIADGLQGKTAAWRQTNYYSSSYASQTDITKASLPDDLKFLYDAGASYYPVFNDVALAVAKQSQTTAPGQLTTGDVVTSSYTLSMPTSTALKNAITSKDQVAVVALLIDKNTKRIANAAKYYMDVYDPTTVGISSTAADARHEVSRYAVDGRQLRAAQKGLNIVRMADGTTRKVIVR